jgi:hypothetical protein
VAKIIVDIGEGKISCWDCTIKIWLSPLQRYFCPVFYKFLTRTPTAVREGNGNTFRVQECLDSEKEVKPHCG